MKTERWQKVEEIFHAAIAQPLVERANYLNQVCAEDLTLRQEIESLIAFSEEAQDKGFLKDQVLKPQTSIWSIEALIGQIIDEKYRIEKLLGQGGMGAVYLATHLGTGRTVAIKIIAPQFMNQAEFVERFKREAEATGRLRHPNVINVTDFGFSSLRQDKLAYLVMEYLNGNTLSDLLKKQAKLPLDLVVDIVEQICLAVEEAHKIGIIHRDLKPDNIWLEPNGRGSYNVKVLDFGLAKLRDVPNGFQNVQLPLLERLNLIEERPNEVSLISMVKGQGLSTEEITLKQEDYQFNSGAKVTHGNVDAKTVPIWLTRVGMVLGTPLYMSPEQCHGRPLDNSSDVYSVGVMTYQMLTGETPFTGDFHQLIDKHTNMPPPLIKEKRKDLPDLVNNTVMSALAKNPIDRPKSMVAFATALKANAQTEISLIRQAISIYSSNFKNFLAMSALASLPSIFALAVLFLWATKIIQIIMSSGLFATVPANHNNFVAFLLMGLLLTHTPLMFFRKLVQGCLIIPSVLETIKLGDKNLSLGLLIKNFVAKKKDLLPLLKNIVMTILVINLSAIGSFFLQEYLKQEATKQLSIFVSMAASFSQYVPSLFFAISFWLLKTSANGIFYEVSVVTENLRGKEATTRSIFLSKEYKKNKMRIYPALLIMFVDLMILSSSLIWVGNKVLSGKHSNTDFFMVFLAGIVGIYAITLIAAIIAPLLAISNALFYLKARQSTGETLDEIFEKYQQSVNTTNIAKTIT
jgi:serine/threonine protein kinase